MRAALTLGALVVGIGIGWMLKASSGSENAAAGSFSGKSKSRSATVEGSTGGAGSTAEGAREIPAGKSHERPAMDSVKEAPHPELDAVANKMMAVLEGEQAKRSEERIAKLVSRLGLNSAQEARLREFFRKKDAGTNIAVGENGRTVRMAKDQEGASLEDFMKDLLSDPQKASYEQLKEAETNQRVEARALREMASLTQAVELREDQREAVYGIIQEQARQDSGGPGIPADFNFSNIDMVPGGGVAAVASVRIEGQEGDSGLDAGELMDRARQQQQARIDEKVNRLSGILDAEQLAQYRAQLSQGVLLPGP